MDEAKLTKSDTLKKDAMIKALERSFGVVSVACNKVGMSRDTHYRWLKTDDKYKEAVASIKNLAIDFAESMLLENIRDKKESSIFFYLKTQAKSRGYTERQEIDLGNDNHFRIEIIENNEDNKE